MSKKDITGTSTTALKNRALFIVAFLMVLLSVFFFYHMTSYQKRELKNIAQTYDTLIKKYYDVSSKYIPISYLGLGTQLLAGKAVVSAIHRQDREALRRLTRNFLDNQKTQAPWLREINWYFSGNIEHIKIYSSENSKRHSVATNPLVSEVIKSGTTFSKFFIDGNQMIYRHITPISFKPGVQADIPGVRGALEFVVDPGQFLNGIEDMLAVDTAILLKSANSGVRADMPGAVTNPDWQKIFPGYYIKFETNSSGFNWLGQLNGDPQQLIQSGKEISVNHKSYLLHNNISIKDYQGNPIGEILSVHDITQVSQWQVQSFQQVVIIAAGIFLIAFLILYYSFGRLMSGLVGRDLQLETVNQELQSEISERKMIENELKTHRDHLEELIAEGTMELEIKSQEIEANEMKLRTVTSSIRDSILMTDCNGNIVFWNEAALRTFGYDEAHMRINDFFKHIVPVGSYEKFMQSFGDALKTESKNSYGRIYEIDCPHKNGEIFPVELMVSQVEIQDDINLIALIRDVTLKRDEETQKRILLRAVEQSSVAIQISDTKGVIQYVNPKFTEVSGYAKEEVIGKKTSILKSNFNPEEDYHNLWKTISAGKDWQGELYNRRKNGDLYWDSTLISPIKDVNGVITHFVAIKEDITERKNLEVELLSAKESAEAASRAKGEFLANMSHEIRTPMNAIMGMTQLALGTELDQEQREYLEIVSQASSALLKLLNDILDFSKVDAGKLLLEPKTFDFRKVMSDTVKTLAAQAHTQSLELLCFIDNDVPHQLIGDSGRLRQIVVNLIGNSIKFTEEGEIVLKIVILEDSIEEKVLLHFVVSDTGIGLHQDQLGYIFEKFAQVDSSSTRKYGGTGLGLTISAKLVELMGGVIWAESPATFTHSLHTAPGSTFHFTALFEIAHHPAQDKTRQEFKVLSGLPTLIVDDNATNRKFLHDTLIKFGLKIELAASGQAALDILKERPDHFGLIILDFRMPEIDGAEVLECIRNILKINTPVILLTSGLTPEDMQSFKNQPASTHLLKPVNIQDLMQTMLVVMGHKTMEPQEKHLVHDNVLQVEKKIVVPLDILVAEDNAINQRLIRRLLEKEGHAVQIVSDGKKALETFIERSQDVAKMFDMILMDIQMPNMDGLEATSNIRAIDKKIPIIALTAHAMKGDKRKFLAQGMNDYISKPIDKALLFDVIARNKTGGRA